MGTLDPIRPLGTCRGPIVARVECGDHGDILGVWDS